MAFFVAAGILILLGLVPGMPHLMFLSLGAGSAVLAYTLAQSSSKRELTVTMDAATIETAKANTEELGWDDVDQVDLVGLDIGYGLIPLVNADAGGQLLTRVKGVRKKLSAELGFLFSRFVFATI